MGDLTLLELRDEIDKNLGSRTANLSSPDLSALNTRYARAINFVQKQMARKHTFSELYRLDRVQITPVGNPIVDRLYEMPANTKEIYSLIWQDGDEDTTSSGHKIIRIPNRQWDALIGTSWTTSTGTPVHYSRWANADKEWLLEFYPVPNIPGMLNRKYAVKPVDLSGNDEISLFQDKDDLIIAWATEWMFKSLGELEDSNNWRQTRLELWQDALKDDMSQPDMSYMQRGSTETAGSAPPYWLDPFKEDQDG